LQGRYKLFSYKPYKDILAGSKKLLKTQKVNWVEQVPQWTEFTSKNVWMSVKNDPKMKHMLDYFPDYGSKRLPDRFVLLLLSFIH
jgi:hypothetical protein